MALVLAFPTIHGGDAAARLANADSLVLGYQLPLPQGFVWLGKALSDDPVLVRLLFCLWGGVLVSGLAALLSLQTAPRAAWFAGLLLAFDPFLAHYSIVPYQEPVAYGLLVWAFYLGLSNRLIAGGLLMAGACLSRFECWLFLPIFFFATSSRAATLLGVLPVAGWTLWWKGLAPAGLYVLDLDARGGRLSRVAFLGRKFVEYETWFIAVLAIVGLLLAVRGPERAVLKGVTGVVLIIAIVITFGHEYPPGSGLMSERLIHLPVLLALALAAVALARVSGTSRVALVFCLAVAIALTGRNALFEVRLLRAAAMDQDLALARDTARAIEAVRLPGECVNVTAPFVDPKLLADYVGKVEASFGDVASARERALRLSTRSPDVDRIAAHLRAPVGTVREESGCPLLVLVDTLTTTEPASTLIGEVSAGPRRARLFRIPR